MKKLFKNPSIYRGMACVFAFLLVIMILACFILEDNRIMVDQTLGTHSQLIVSENDDNSLFTAYTPDEKFLTDGKLDYMGKDINIHKDLSVRIQEEGTVLMKNERKTLPISKTAKVTLFGYRAYSHPTNSYGMASSNPIKDALASKGVEINPTMEAVYGGLSKTTMAPGWASNKTYDYKFDPNEPGEADIAAQNADYAASFSGYNDAAIVVIGRTSAEGADYKPGADGVQGGAEVARTALALYPKEKEIINLACNNFDKVIVVLYTINPIEIGELKDNDKVGAIMWMGIPYDWGSFGLANLIVGDANPSGGLYDIYARNTLSSPAMRNFGHYELTNADQITRPDTTSVGTRGTDPGFQHYVIQAEGIYYGYRYYETRYYDTVLNRFGAKTKTDTTGIYEDSKTDWNYSEEVAYGFGYGLSYTTFDQKIKNVTWKRSAHEQIAHVEVEVTNTGDVAGKTSVQIYGQAPYTKYDMDNRVEKSAVQLLSFEKTGEIAKGATVTVTVDVDLQDLASYDEFGAGTYIMENGDHYLAVGNGAHDALNNILALQGKKKADGMDYDGKAAAAYKWTYDTASADNGVDSYTFSYSKAGVKIENQLKYSDWNEYEAGKVTYLSRQDWVGTFPKTYSNMTATAQMLKHYNGNVIDVKTASNPDSAEALAEVKLGEKTELKFADMKFADFNDYRWEELLNALTLEELTLFCMESGRGFAGLASIGFPAGSYAENGPGVPNWISNEPGVQNAPWAIEKIDGVSTYQSPLGNFPAFSVLAATFSRDLAKEYGETLGNDSIIGNKPMLWLPGANLHRTSYNGRSEQYLCEDPVLTGIITMETAYGALQKGAIVTAKHFAFNDQEMHRSGVGTFMTEQKAREIELHGFQIAFEMNKYDTDEKDVGMLGVMTAFNKLGGIECTVNEGLLTGILKKEWNFHGYSVSDLKDDLDLMPQAFKAGLGGYDWRTASDDIDPYKSVENYKYDAELLKAMKEVAHQKLWVFANSNLMNIVNTTTHNVWNMTWWRALYIAGIVISAALLLAAIPMYVIAYRYKKKEEN